MKKKAYRVIGYSILLLVVLAALGSGWGLQSQSFAEDATDLYFKTPGIPDGPSAPSPQETVYRALGRSIVDCSCGSSRNSTPTSEGLFSRCRFFVSCLNFWGSVVKSPNSHFAMTVLREIWQKSPSLPCR